MTTLVVDIGQNLVGIFSVEEQSYHPYRGAEISAAVQRIAEADEVITYNGKNYDLRELGRFAGLDVDLPLKGIHSDMRSICWSDRIWGSSLGSTFADNFGSPPRFPDTHQGSNQLDIYMTFRLWQAWKAGTLMILDGARTAKS